MLRFLEADKPLPEKYRFLLFEDKREVELVWNGKSGDVCNIVLPFQTIEQIDEPRSEADKEKSDPQMQLFSTDDRGRQLKGWTNKLIWGDNKLILSSLKNGPLREEIERQGGLKLIYIDREGRSSIEPMYAVGWHDLVAATSDKAPKLSIAWDGKEYPNVYTAKVAIWNQGRQFLDKTLISTTDPIRLVYPDGITVLSAEISFTSRSSLNLKARIATYEEQDVVVVEIVGDDALEHHDGAVLNVTYTRSESVAAFGEVRGPLPDGQADFEVKGRIKGSVGGFRRIPIRDATRPRWLNLAAAAVFILHFLVIGLVGVRASREPAKPLELVLGVVGFLFSAGLFFFTSYTYFSASIDWPTWVSRAG